MIHGRVAGLACAVALIAGGVRSPAIAAVKNPGTFVFLTNGDVDSLDPAWEYDNVGGNLIDNVYETLFRFAGAGVDAGSLTPLLAAKIPTIANGLISRDGRVYRIPIRRGVKFQDGSELIPDDVRYSLLRFMLTDRSAGPSALLLEPVLGLTTTRPKGRLREDAYDLAAQAVTVDGGDVVIRLHKPFAPFLSILAGYGAVVSRKWCAAHGQWDGGARAWKRYNNPALEAMIPAGQANGTGPFRLERFDSAAKQTVLARYDGYWRGPAKLARVIVKMVPEFETRKLMLTAGDADSIVAPVAFRSRVEGIPGARIIDGLQPLTVDPMLGFNFKINPAGNENIGSGKLDGRGIPSDFFADKDVREAFAYAIDYDAYLRGVLNGKARRMVGVIPPGMLGHLDRPPKYAFDLKKSEEHFRKAFGGQVWKSGFRFKIPVTGDNPANHALFQMIKRNVESLNPRFSIEVRPVLTSTHLSEMAAHQLPLTNEGWSADYADPHSFAFSYLASDGFYGQQQGYRNPEVDRLISEAESEQAPSRRAALYARLQDLAEEDLPVAPIAIVQTFRTQRSWVKGFVFNPAFPDMPYGSYYYDLSKSE